MMDAYRRYLPADRTLWLDGQQSPATLAAITFNRVRELQVTFA
jgi:hypothetical protein